jgi:hypothetical protein
MHHQEDYHLLQQQKEEEIAQLHSIYQQEISCLEKHIDLLYTKCNALQEARDTEQAYYAHELKERSAKIAKLQENVIHFEDDCIYPYKVYYSHYHYNKHRYESQRTKSMIGECYTHLLEKRSKQEKLILENEKTQAQEQIIQLQKENKELRDQILHVQSNLRYRSPPRVLLSPLVVSPIQRVNYNEITHNISQDLQLYDNIRSTTEQVNLDDNELLESTQPADLMKQDAITPPAEYTVQEHVESTVASPTSTAQQGSNAFVRRKDFDLAQQRGTKRVRDENTDPSDVIQSAKKPRQSINSTANSTANSSSSISSRSSHISNNDTATAQPASESLGTLLRKSPSAGVPTTQKRSTNTNNRTKFLAENLLYANKLPARMKQQTSSK